MDNYLVHHGILGMKWGVRRYQNKDGTLTELGKVRGKSEERKTKEVKKTSQSSIDPAIKKRNDMIQQVKNVRNLSDSELQSLTSRLRAEQTLRQLSDAELEPGKAFVKKFLKNSASEAAEKVSKVVMLKVAKEIAKALGYNDIAEAIFQEPKSKKDDKNK